MLIELEYRYIVKLYQHEEVKYLDIFFKLKTI